MATSEATDAAGPPAVPPESPTPPAEAPYRRPLNLLPYPYFSQQERDRRWALTRAAMAQRGVDCLVIPNNTGHATTLQADARYLTHVGGGGDADAAVVFPLEGEPAAIVTNRDRWVHTQPWCHDLREAKRSYGAGVLAKLRDLPVAPRRIGLVGLADAVNAPEGTAGQGFLAMLMRELPDVTWLNFTPEMEAIRIVKSSEEMAFIEHSMAVVDSAYAAAFAALCPGVTDHFVWGTVVEALCVGGSELPVALRWAGAHHPHRMHTHPSSRLVESGWLFRTEIEAAWGGYRARGGQSFACAQPDPAYLEMAAFLADVWRDTLPQMRPGALVGEVIEATTLLGARYSPGAGPLEHATATLRVNGCGLGADAPEVTPSRARPQDLARPIAPGWCIFCTVAVQAGDYRLGWGDTIAITEGGARGLSQAQPGIAVVGI